MTRLNRCPAGRRADRSRCSLKPLASGRKVDMGRRPSSLRYFPGSGVDAVSGKLDEQGVWGGRSAGRRPGGGRGISSSHGRGDAPERAALALSLGELGVAPRRQLSDDELMIRACAALAPALAHDSTATGIVVDALTDPSAIDRWLPHRTPQLVGWLRFRFVAAAIERVSDFDQLLPGAIAIARISSGDTVDRDWGPMLEAAFSTPLPRQGPR